MSDQTERVRIDKWLWATRFYKTRQLAVKAIKNSQVLLQNNAAKPASAVKVGDLVTIRKGLFETEIEVLGLNEKRTSAKIAQTLYQETPSSVAARQKLQNELDNQPKIAIDRRKPDKRRLRDSRAFKRQL